MNSPRYGVFASKGVDDALTFTPEMGVLTVGAGKWPISATENLTQGILNRSFLGSEKEADGGKFPVAEFLPKEALLLQGGFRTEPLCDIKCTELLASGCFIAPPQGGRVVVHPRDGEDSAGPIQAVEFQLEDGFECMRILGRVQFARAELPVLLPFDGNQQFIALGARVIFHTK